MQELTISKTFVTVFIHLC